MTAAFALTIDVFAFAIWQVLEQVLQTAFAPVGHLGRSGHGFHLLHNRLTNHLGPIAAGAIHVWNSADISAAWAILSTARFLLHVDIEASVDFVAFGAADFETAHAALIR